jgi:REP element-mobilizing transposase RayT
MARCARRKSESGIFHIMLRGINNQSIFEDNEDRERFLNMIERYRKVSEYNIYGHCLMGNYQE